MRKTKKTAKAKKKQSATSFSCCGMMSGMMNKYGSKKRSFNDCAKMWEAMINQSCGTTERSGNAKRQCC